LVAATLDLMNERGLRSLSGPPSLNLVERVISRAVGFLEAIDHRAERFAALR
jgi:hypothetical protein